MQPFISKLLIDIRPATQFNTPTWTTFFLESGILKPCYVWPLQNYSPKSLSKLMPHVLVSSAHLHAAQMLPTTLVLLQPTTLCGRIKDLHAWLASSSTHIHASAEQPLLCGSAQLLPATPIYVGPRLVLNLQEPNFGFSHILQLASRVDHSFFFCPRAFVAKRAVPFFN